MKFNFFEIDKAKKMITEAKTATGMDISQFKKYCEDNNINISGLFNGLDVVSKKVSSEFINKVVLKGQFIINNIIESRRKYSFICKTEFGNFEFYVINGLVRVKAGEFNDTYMNFVNMPFETKFNYYLFN